MYTFFGEGKGVNQSGNMYRYQYVVYSCSYRAVGGCKRIFFCVCVYSVLPGNLHKHGGGAAQATMNTVKCHRFYCHMNT